MRLALRIFAALLALVLLLGGGVASAEICPPVDAGVDDSLGAAPIVDATGPEGLPVLLGTALRIQWSDYDTVWGVVDHRFLVQAASVSTVGEPTATRLLQIVVRFRAVLGAVDVNESDFWMIDVDGSRYRPVAAPDDGSVSPLAGGALLPEAGIIEGAVYFAVPVHSPGLLIGYDPSPSDVIAGTWTLSAP